MVHHLTSEEFLTSAAVVMACILILLFSSLQYHKIRERDRRRKEKKQAEEKMTSAQRKAAEELTFSSTPVGEATPWFRRLQDGLAKTHQNIIGGLEDFFHSKKDQLKKEELFERLFELLISSDVGVTTSELLIEKLRVSSEKTDVLDFDVFLTHLKTEILELLSVPFENKLGTLEHPKQSPHVVLMVGVNGVGKTTTTGKLAYKMSQQGAQVVIGAADTFRAAATEQLSVWAERAGAKLIQAKDSPDPGAVAYRAVETTLQSNASVCFVDTAGRLQTRADLMQELSKIARVMHKAYPGCPHEVLLVLDATTGQNAIQQAKIFREMTHVTGIILTKLDGTAKGGVALPIASELGIPIRYVGVGESIEDLHEFKPEEFVNALIQDKK